MQDTLSRLHTIVGDAGFVTDPEIARPMLVDERRQYQGRAAAIVMPQTTRQLADAVRVCFDAGVAMVPQGGNTGYCGGATPDESGAQVLFKLSRMNRIRQIDERGFTLTADAGVVLAEARRAAAARDLLLPLSMGSEGSCQLGGNVSTNAGGLAVLRYGTARELVAGLEVVLPDGRVWSDLKGLRKDNTGYDLKQLFMGAEGTLGIISAVVLRLQPMPRERLSAWLAIGDIGDAVTTLAYLRNRLGDCVTSFEYISRESLALVLGGIPGTRSPLDVPGAHYALIELAAFGADASLAREFERSLDRAISAGYLTDAIVAQSDGQRRAFWRLRESIPEAEQREGGSIKHDVSVVIGALGGFVGDAITATRAQFPRCRLSIYGHVGDGNIHFNVLAPQAQAAVEFKRDSETAISALIHGMAVGRGGSFSAEHGVGRLKRALLAETADPVALGLMRGIKATLDPKGLMNPGKVI
jgi:FAD/FMN-containing dehydrogenase